MNYIVTTISGAIYNVTPTGTVVGGSLNLDNGKLIYPRVQDLSQSLGQRMSIAVRSDWFGAPEVVRSVRTSPIMGVRMKE